MTPAEFLPLVDHTLLKAEATLAQVEQVAREGRELGVAAVCVNSLWVPTAHGILAGGKVRTCAVVAFPLGAMDVQTACEETRVVVGHGAAEVDVVVPLGLVKAGAYAAVTDHLGAVRNAASGATLKVILETAVLTDEEIVNACEASVEAGVDFVKTSTGFHAAGGASEHAVRLMRQTVGLGIGVKASGGIRTLADVERMVAAGADRLGLSATMSILGELGV